MKKTLFILPLILIASAFFMLHSESQKLREQTITIQTRTGTKVTLKAEMALTHSEQMKGYMERTFIPDGSGMLFVFSGEKFQSFWMKNTPTALSIAYIRADGKICDIFDMKPFDLTSIESTQPAQYALEVPKGWFKKAGISIGDRLILDF